MARLRAAGAAPVRPTWDAPTTADAPLRRGLCAVTMLDDPLPLRPCPLTRCLRCVKCTGGLKSASYRKARRWRPAAHRLAHVQGGTSPQDGSTTAASPLRDGGQRGANREERQTTEGWIIRMARTPRALFSSCSFVGGHVKPTTTLVRAPDPRPPPSPLLYRHAHLHRRPRRPPRRLRRSHHHRRSRRPHRPPRSPMACSPSGDTTTNSNKQQPTHENFIV